jgi:Polyketide cyclase / dehydrase and lipid transport
MKFLKKLLFFILGLVVVALIAAIFIKQDLNAEKEIVINKPNQQVFAYIKQLKNQNNYSKWASMDANMKKEYKGTDGTVGFVSSWDSDNSEVGKGEQEIVKITEGEKIDYELRFIKPMASKNTAYMTTKTVNDSTTKVTWGFAGKMNYPFNIFRLFIDVEKTVGEDFATGLTNLKSILEKVN